VAQKLITKGPSLFFRVDVFIVCPCRFLISAFANSCPIIWRLRKKLKIKVKCLMRFI
jgi:hypothetical protein